MTEQNKLILVIEDEADTAEMFAEMLKLSGYEVIKVIQSADAVQAIKEKRPDAILLDLMMPEISGLEILREVRQNPELEHIPTIVISAKQLPEDIKSGFEAGATEYLTKPVTFQSLISTLETHINSA